MSDGAGCVDPGIIRRGTGLVASVGGGGSAVCGSLAEGDAPSSPELTVRADGDAVDWMLCGPLLTAVAGEYNYCLPRRALPEVRHLLCVLPRMIHRGRREMGRFWDRHQLLIGIEDVEIFTLGERGFLWRKRKRGKFGGKNSHGGESPGCKYRSLFCDGAER